MGRNQHLSIFFVVMKGEYDDLLTWPFKQRVTFCLLAPGNPSSNRTETFVVSTTSVQPHFVTVKLSLLHDDAYLQPDSDSTSFQKPHNEMNIASGCPQFLLQSEVETSTYLINDAIYIKIRVEPGGDSK